MCCCEAWKLAKTEAKKLGAFQYMYMRRVIENKVASDHITPTNPGAGS